MTIIPSFYKFAPFLMPHIRKRCVSCRFQEFNRCSTFESYFRSLVAFLLVNKLNFSLDFTHDYIVYDVT